MDKKKQIEELAKTICDICRQKTGCSNGQICTMAYIEAEGLYKADYRKQSKGEWKIKSEIHKLFDDIDEELYVECPFCKRTFWIPYEFEDEKIFEYAREHYPYCNCGASMNGAKMKGV